MGMIFCWMSILSFSLKVPKMILKELVELLGHSDFLSFTLTVRIHAKFLGNKEYSFPTW